MAGRNARTNSYSIAVKLETTPGVDAFGGTLNAPGTPAATDFIRVTGATPSTPQDTTNTNELTGQLDVTPPQVGGLRGAIQLTAIMRGNGVAGSAPRIGRLFQICAMQEIVSAAIAATAGTAGDARRLTLKAPYQAVDALYEGMPFLLTGNPAIATLAYAEDQVGFVTRFGYTFSPVLSTSTLAALQANVLYAPISDESLFKTATVYVYMGGYCWQFTGVVGTWTMNMQAGQVPTATFNLQGQFYGYTEANAPTASFEPLAAPVFKKGLSRLNGVLARVQAFTLDQGNTLENPPNPEADNGFDPAIITQRSVSGTVNPLMTTGQSVSEFANFQAGAESSYVAACGTVAGNRLGITVPGLVYTDATVGESGSLANLTLPWRASQANRGALICFS